jgi:hypothetical protein
MASSSKKRTTMAKITRENKLRERRMDKQARKDARKQAAVDGTTAGEPADWLGEPAAAWPEETTGEEPGESSADVSPAQADPAGD